MAQENATFSESGSVSVCQRFKDIYLLNIAGAMPDAESQRPRTSNPISTPTPTPVNASFQG